MGVVHMLVSPAGGRGRARAASAVVSTVVGAAGHTVDDISGRTVEASVGAAQAAVEAGAERLVVVGGDGTVHIALQAVAGTNTVLGVVPAGTGNDFARHFGLLGATVEQASARALGSSQHVDAIAVDAMGAKRIWVATSVTGGFSADVNNLVMRLRFPRGRSRYTAATLLTAPGLRHRRLAFTVDGRRRRIEFTTTLWAVANTPDFGGGMAICPGADPGDGLLDLVVVADVGRVTLLRMLPTVFNGAHVRHRKVHTFRDVCITVEDGDVADRITGVDGDGCVEDAGITDAAGNVDVAGVAPSEVDGDGERIGTLPVTLTAVRGAIRLAADPPDR